ncbi:MAG TPA: PRC-barrel domain-containing protein [Albitalea sp.]|jgi:sporulation protein YlmC with PRC-barrel domain|nr:PRC-barrel domain-containing protein [Albitalea sp.]
MHSKSLVRSAIVCALLSATLADHAQAQAASGASAPAVQLPVAGRAVLGVTIAETQLLATGYRASRLLKQDVFNDKGDKIGKVDDLIVSTDGTLSIAVIEVGGFLGMGKHLVAIPVRQFAHIAPKAVLPSASKDELKKLPKFEYTS